MGEERHHFYEFGPFRIDTKARRLSRDGEAVPLTSKAFETLWVLVRNSERVVSKDELMQTVWPDTVVEENNLHRSISMLRKALGENRNEPQYIVMVPGQGYRFIASIRMIPDGPTDPIRSATIPSDAVLNKEMTLESEPADLLKEPVRSLTPAVPTSTERPRRLRPELVAIGLLLVGLAAAVAYFWRTISSKRADTAMTIRALAVLPLVNLSADPAQEYLADGMTEALINTLAQISGLRVSSQTSVMAYKGARKPLPEIAQILHVDAVIEGSVQRSGDRVRIAVQLIHAATDHHLWAKTYEHNLGDILVLQSQMAQAVAREIHLQLTPVHPATRVDTRPVNGEAYEAYLRGRYFWNKGPQEGYKKSMEYFQQAIERDPAYAPAYAGLADCYVSRAIGEVVPAKETFPQAKAAALRALELDDALAEAHVSLASVKLDYEWDWPAAEKEFQRALELNPNYARAHLAYASFLTTLGRHSQAMAEIKRAQALDPVSPLGGSTAGLLFYYAREYDQAIEQLQKIVEMDAHFAPPHADLEWAYMEKGMYEEAVSEWLKALTIKGTDPKTVAALREAYVASGIRGYWRKRLDHLLEEGSNRRYFRSCEIATHYARLGEKDQALAWLEQAYADRSLRLKFLKRAPWWDGLRSDARFVDLVRRVGIPP